MSAGLRLTINLENLTGNWKRLSKLSKRAECAAAVKADAYGIGLEQAVPALSAAGCRTFFVALPEEGVRVRQVAPQADIYVLNGFFDECAALYRQNRLWPVLGDPGQIGHWARWRKDEPAALHVDTGMNRLGLSSADAARITDADIHSAGIALVMSHLACADTPDHPMNRVQLERFRTFAARFAQIPASLANSAAIHSGPAFHFDMVRPGIALYGGASHPDAKSKPVVLAESRILQVRDAEKGDKVGYGAAQTLKKKSRIAILSAGYADGYLRAAGGSDKVQGANVAIAGCQAPVAGRVSMDLIAVDVTAIPAQLLDKASWAELFGGTIDINDVASAAGTIAYELLTGLSPRAERIYVSNGAPH